MSKEQKTRENIDQMTARIIDSQRNNGQTVDRAAVRERVRKSFIRNERENNNR
jgi:hypothetical protein